MGLDDLLGGIGDVAISGRDPNDGCMVVFAILGIMAAIAFGLSKIFPGLDKEPNKPKIEQVEKKPKETISHFLGRKTKESVIEFGKGVIGK